MKKSQLLFLLLLLFAFRSSFAQLNHPFPNKDGEWVVGGGSPGGTWQFKNFVEKDTIINNKEYSIIKAGEYYVRAAVRSDSAKVYAVNINDHKEDIYLPIDTTEYVLYDYGLKVGDIFTIINYSEWSWIPYDTVDFNVTTVDYIDVKGESRKRIGLSGAMNNQYWIEGIGSTRSPLYHAFMTEFEESFRLKCYCENGITLYGYCKTDKVDSYTYAPEARYSAPEKLLILNGAENSIFTIVIIDTKGQMVCSSTEHANSQIDLSFLRKGIYIVALQNGTYSFSQKIIIP